MKKKLTFSELRLKRVQEQMKVGECNERAIQALVDGNIKENERAVDEWKYWMRRLKETTKELTILQRKAFQAEP